MKKHHKITLGFVCIIAFEIIVIGISEFREFKSKDKKEEKVQVKDENPTTLTKEATLDLICNPNFTIKYTKDHPKIVSMVGADGKEDKIKTNIKYWMLANECGYLISSDGDIVKREGMQVRDVTTTTGVVTYPQSKFLHGKTAIDDPVKDSKIAATTITFKEKQDYSVFRVISYDQKVVLDVTHDRKIFIKGEEYSDPLRKELDDLKARVKKLEEQNAK